MALKNVTQKLSEEEFGGEFGGMFPRSREAAGEVSRIGPNDVDMALEMKTV